MKNKKLIKVLSIILSTIFNLLELGIIVLIGVFMNISMQNICIDIILFVTIRNILGGAKHYKNPFKCLLWTTLDMITIFLVAKYNFWGSLLVTTIAAISLSDKGDIKDCTMFPAKITEDSRFYIIKEFRDKNTDTELLKCFEDFLLRNSKKYYEIYEKRYILNLSYEEISHMLNIDNREITNRLDVVLLCFQMYFKDEIEELKIKN